MLLIRCCKHLIFHQMLISISGMKRSCKVLVSWCCVAISMVFLVHLSHAFYWPVLKPLSTNQMCLFPYSFRFAHPAHGRNHCPKWQVSQWTIPLCERQMNTSHNLSTLRPGLLWFNLSTYILPSVHDAYQEFFAAWVCRSLYKGLFLIFSNHSLWYILYLVDRKVNCHPHFSVSV